MKPLILFGASTLGIRAKKMLEQKRDVIYFCDNDELKIGTKVDGLEVIDIYKLKSIGDDFDILITSGYYREISEQLLSEGLDNFEVFYDGLYNIYGKKANRPDISQINLYDFLINVPQIQLPKISFITGGSKVMDYAFLQALVRRFHVKTYLEIGSFIGESINSVIQWVDRAYSISLPDQALNQYFKSINKINFSSYLLQGNPKVTQYKSDSRYFEFSSIKDKLDLVFIDGDHSYTGVYFDTKNIFSVIDKRDTFVVWHDYKVPYGFRKDTLDAIEDALPIEIRKNIYGVDINLCGVYIPEKYLSRFSFQQYENKLQTYMVSVHPNDI